MSVALSVEDVSIRYITGDFKEIGIKEYTVRRLTGKYHVKEFMAVDGVSFRLETGDMLGIVGTNGAGKSTLLKAISGIMAPTHGKIEAVGEVAALLELGSGFDGDLTVRENAYLRGAMLGYTRAFMDRTYEGIIDFAELKEYEDRPFKQLSSGMKSRLAFSIASLVDPDILILDEVLSVGDGAFQEKSAAKMREIMAKGTTTILVSHSLEQIRKLCDKVLWLDHGKQIAFGPTQSVCDGYEQFLNGEHPVAYYQALQYGEQTDAQAPEAAAMQPIEAPEDGAATDRTPETDKVQATDGASETDKVQVADEASETDKVQATDGAPETDKVQATDAAPEAGQTQELSETGSPAQTPGEAARPGQRRRRTFPQLLRDCILPSLIVALAIGILCQQAQKNLPRAGVPATVTAQTAAGAVVFRGAIIDGTWTNPETLLTDAGNWRYIPEENTYAAVDDTPLLLQLPVSDDCALTFDAGPDAGAVSVEVNGETTNLTLYNDEAMPDGNSYLLPPVTRTNDASTRLILTCAAALVLLALTLCFPEKQTQSHGRKRECWIDLLKVCSALMIVLIHVVGTGYSNVPVTDGTWPVFLFLNALPRFAVPLFIMVSGAMFLGKDIPLSKALRNAGKALILLVFWNLFYILLIPVIGWEHGDILRQILSLPVERGPSGHLWYAYLLVWIYLFSPIVSALYRALNHRRRVYFAVLTVLIPGLLQLYRQLFQLGGTEVVVPYSLYMTLPYMGMMFIGRLIYDGTLRENGRMTAGAAAAAAIGGLLATFALSFAVSRANGAATDLFLPEGNVLVVVYAAGIFALARCKKDRLERLGSGVKACVTALAAVSLGIYFAHCAVMFLLPTFSVFGFTVSQSGGPLSVVAYTLSCYLLTVVLTLMIKKIPGLRRIVV